MSYLSSRSSCLTPSSLRISLPLSVIWPFPEYLKLNIALTIIYMLFNSCNFVWFDVVLRNFASFS
jgi:hypothetical protein